MICKKGNAKTEKRESMRGGNGTVTLEHPFGELPSGDSAMVRNGKHSVEGISDEPCRILAVIVNDIQ